MAKNAFKLSPMVEEKFEIHSSQMAKNANNVGRAHNVGQGETLDQFSGVAIIAPPPGLEKIYLLYILYCIHIHILCIFNSYYIA